MLPLSWKSRKIKGKNRFTTGIVSVDCLLLCTQYLIIPPSNLISHFSLLSIPIPHRYILILSPPVNHMATRIHEEIHVEISIGKWWLTSFLNKKNSVSDWILPKIVVLIEKNDKISWIWGVNAYLSPLEESGTGEKSGLNHRESE